MQELNFEQIYNEHFKTVYKYLICLTHDREIAEDLTQETFCKAINKIDEFNGKCKLSVWLCKIAKNLWLNEMHRANIITTVEENDEYIDLKQNIEENFLKKQDVTQLYKKNSKLEESIKDVFYLRLFGNLSFKEIGEILGKGEVWARVNFYRGKQKIKEVGKNEKRV